jgi:hypothetical protein
MNEIILDKSYLDTATPEQVHALCSENIVLMPEVLFYELTTTDETSMRSCFNKFPDTTNPVELIPNIGTLLRYELITREPCIPLYNRREKIVFNFNSRLRTGAFEFTEAQVESRQNREAIVKKEAEDFFELAMMVAAFFPQINGIPYADLPAKIQAAKTQVATDIPTVRTIYAQLSEAGEGLNPFFPETLNPNWAFFRWVQVRCLYSLDLIFRYAGSLPSSPTPRFWTSIEHDMLDSQYVILASLSGALACNENRMIQFFHLIRPDGVLFTCRKE